MSLVKEFKEFAFKGNVLDMAVAFILGVAFKDVVTSLTNDIIMPVIGVFTGGIDFSDKKVVLSPAVVDAAGKVVKPENAITYGVLIQTVITFFIVALVLFFIVKGFLKLQKKEQEKPAPPPPPTKEEVLLTEIRDLLKR